MDILKKLLIILLFVFPLGALVRIEVVKNAYLYPLDVILVIVFLYSTFIYITNQKKLDELTKAFFYFIGFGLLSLLVNSWWLGLDHTLIASLYLVRFVFFANLIVVFQYLDKKFRYKYLLELMFSGFVIVLLGYIQYWYYPNLRNLYYLGWDDHMYRMFSTFLDPNFAGAFFVLQCILSLAFLLLTPRCRKSYFFLISFLLSFAAVFLSYSRTAYIMLVISIPFFLLLTRRFKIILLFVALVIIGIIAIPKNLHSEGVDLLRTASVVARINTYQEALTVFKTSPVYGVGFNSYLYAREKNGFFDTSKYETHSEAGVANSYIFTLVTTGIIGLVLWLNIFRVIFMRSIVQVKKMNIFAASFMLTITIAVLIGSLFENIFFYESIMFWLFSVLGLLYVD